MAAVGSECPAATDPHGQQMTAEGWRGVQVVKEQDAVAARPPADELHDGVVKCALLDLVLTLAAVDVEDEEVAVGRHSVHAVADGRRLARDNGSPGRLTFEPHHGLVQGEDLGWSEVLGEDGEAVVVERCDLLNHVPLDTYRGGLCNVKVAGELLERLAEESVDDVLLPPLLLPVHVQVWKVDDAHTDMHCDEAPYLLRCRKPTQQVPA